MNNLVTFNEKLFGVMFSLSCLFCCNSNSISCFCSNLRSDNTKEYMFKQFQSFMVQNGILNQTSCVDTHSHNGVSKIKKIHLLETARALLL